MNDDIVEVGYNDPDLYVVWVYDECNMLSNALKALAYFRRHTKKSGSLWPKSVGIRRGNRLSFGLGDDIRIAITDWMLIDAMYMSLYKPYRERCDKRVPTICNFGKRSPMKDTKGIIFRSR